MPADFTPGAPGWTAAGLPLPAARVPALPPYRRVDPADAAPGVEPWSSPYRFSKPSPENEAPTTELAPPVPTPVTALADPKLPTLRPVSTQPAAEPIVEAKPQPAPVFEPPAPQPAPKLRPEPPAVRQPKPASVLARTPPRVSPWARRIGFAALVVALPVAGAAFMLVPAQVAHPPSLMAVFTAPTLVLRAAVAGRITAVNTTQGAPVQPDTVLLSIHVDAPDPAADALRARLLAARGRVTGLDAEIAAAAPPGAPDAARARQAYLRQLRAGVATERDQLEQAVAALPSAPADLVVRSRVRGYVRVLEAVAGSDTVAGAPVAQLVDCDRAFLAPQDGTLHVQAGERVRLRIGGLPAFDGLVRPAFGVSEPPGGLVIDPVGLASVAASACPLGSTATVTQAAPAGS